MEETVYLATAMSLYRELPQMEREKTRQERVRVAAENHFIQAKQAQEIKTYLKKHCLR